MLWLGVKYFFHLFGCRGSLAAATQRLSELITYFLPEYGVRSTWYYTRYVLGLAFTPLLYGRRIVSVFITYLSAMEYGVNIYYSSLSYKRVSTKKLFLSRVCPSPVCEPQVSWKKKKKKTEPKRSSLMQKKKDIHFSWSSGEKKN